MQDWDKQWADLFDKTTFDGAKNPNNYWETTPGLYGFFYSSDTYPLSDDNNGQAGNSPFYPYTLPGLT